VAKEVKKIQIEVKKIQIEVKKIQIEVKKIQIEEQKIQTEKQEIQIEEQKNKSLPTICFFKLFLYISSNRRSYLLDIIKK
jgi:hypothetical protein